MVIPEISVAELHALGAGVRLIDVREDDEWNQVRAPHAHHVPMGTVPDRLDEFDGDPTYVICKVGGRSQRVCAYAAAAGKPVVNVAGGMLAWCDAGFDTVAGGV